MKKFLTVLLVIAVMFTFSFGSAFAFTAGDAPDAISDGWFKTLWTDLVKVTSGDNGDVYKLLNTYDIDKSLLAGMEADAKAVYDAYMSDATGYVTSETKDFESIIFGTKEGLAASVKDKADAFCLAVAKAQFAKDKAAALANLDTVPFYNYSTEVMSKKAAELAEGLTKEIVTNNGVSVVVTNVEFVDKDYTYKQAAEKLVEYFKSKVEDFDDFDADVTVADYAAASANIAAYVADGYAVPGQKAVVLPLGYKAANVVALTGAYDIVALYSTYATGKDSNGDDVYYFDVNNSINAWSTKAVASGDKTEAATVAAVKAMNAAKYAAESVNADADKIKYLDKWLKVADVLAEEGYNYEDASKLIAAPNYDTKAYASRAEAMTELEDYAARYGAEKNADGQLIRDAADVQKYLADGKVAIATCNVANVGKELSDAKAKIYNAVSKEISDLLAFIKESAKKDIELKIADYEADEVYYPAELAKIKEYAATYNAKIDAAATAKAAEDAHKEFGIKVSKVKTAEALNTAWVGKGQIEATSAAAQNLLTAAENYVTYYNDNVATEDSAKLVTDTLADRIAEMIGNSGARTDKEIKALKDEAVKVAAALPTQDAVKASAKAARTAIEALPANVTTADLAAVQAASDAIKAYKKLVGADLAEGQKTPLTVDAYTTALAQLVRSYNSQFAQEVAKVSDTDEAAIKTIKADITTAVDAIEALYRADEDTCGYMKTLKETLNTYLNKIKENDAKAVKDAIKAIPINVTEADKATVVKARELYDAYVAKYNDYEHLYAPERGCNDPYTHGYAADDFGTLLGSLTAAETVLGLNVNPAKDVEALKITASSKATKGAITVKWKVVGNKAAADGYVVARSTKKNAGFKKMFTTKKLTYKNTKGLKKGTRYYYKVRAYKVVDGKTYYSDWSNKAYRVAK